MMKLPLTMNKRLLHLLAGVCLFVVALGILTAYAEKPTLPLEAGAYGPEEPDRTPDLYATRTPPFIEPEGCRRPPDDYTRITVGNATLNARTFAMLEYAAELYGGTIPITGAGITQGSYNPGGVSASFGTHDGGGAVDLTVRNIPYSWDIKWEDIPRLIEALRLAGFAAWYRDDRENLVPHIHAIAIGDAELSPIATEQLTGPFGYFRGYDGFPRTNGIPLRPRYGTVVICQWMLDMGYRDLRN